MYRRKSLGPTFHLLYLKSVILCGDLYQLPPVRAKPLFMFDK